MGTKTKMKARELRELNKAANKVKYQQINSAKEAENIVTKEIADEAKAEIVDITSATSASKAKKAKLRAGKSSAKANGLKSVIVYGDRTILTSFGKGNKATLEKEVKGDDILDINKAAPVFDAASEEVQYRIARKGVKLEKAGHVDKAVAVRQDLIGAKSLLEKRYFGTACDNDNVHIQIAYNILDIEKLFAEYIDNILYAVGNVLTGNDEEYEDLIGSMGGKTYENFVKNEEKYKKFKKLYDGDRLRFFGGAFFDTGIDVKARKTEKNDEGETEEKAKKRTEEEVYYILSLLGSIRQFIKHGKITGREGNFLYSLGRALSEPEKELLDKLLGERINALNENFEKTNKNDLIILSKVLDIGQNEKQSLAKDLYRFTVLKENRNLGFSVKKLREYIIEEYMQQIRAQKYDSSRSKIYKQFDFIIYCFVKSEAGSELSAKLVDELRASMTEEDKEIVYKKYAAKIFDGNVKESFEAVEKAIGNGSAISRMRGERYDRVNIDDIKVDANEISSFAKLVFMMTLFIDGKEINDFVCSLINKFENIGSFNELLVSADFVKENEPIYKVEKGDSYGYEFFNQANKVADDLRLVKSVARMATPTPNAKRFMYKDALKVFGFSAEEADEKINDNFFANEKRLRNFINNNVIESSRFQYLIKYANIYNAREFAKSKPIVTFVLKHKITDTQIDRYWLSCGGDNKVTDRDKKIAGLVDIITNFDKALFDQELVRNDKQAEKQKTTAIIGLYLMVIYQVVKGLVKVNSRYTMAFHALERDTRMLCDKTVFDGSKKSKEHNQENYDTLFALSGRYIDKQTAHNEEREKNCKKSKINKHTDDQPYYKRVNKHGLKCIIDSKNSAGNTTAHYHICRMYRNAVAHLGAISNSHKYVNELPDNYKVTSYFALYHYFMQRYLMDSPEFKEPDFEITADDSKISEWADKVKKHKGYCRDFIWALNAPFSYNPPRYKTLSIEDLFYRDAEAVVRDEQD